jgi:hypothetical protein
VESCSPTYLRLSREVEVSLKLPCVSYPLRADSAVCEDLVEGQEQGNFFLGITQNETQISRLPDPQDREGDCNLEMGMLDGSWQMRRIVWTKQTISIARVDEEILVDVIPFSEVDGVEIIPSQLRGETAREHRRSFEQAQARDGLQPAAPSAHSHSLADLLKKHSTSGVLHTHIDGGRQSCLKIRTTPSGFNSGRTYILRSASEEQCTAIIADFAALALAERQLAQAQTKFRQHQAPTPPR